MKKNLLLIFIFGISINTFSQIDIDRFDKDGSRIIISKLKGIGGSIKCLASFRLIDVIDVNDGNTFYLQLTLIGNKKDKEYSKGRKLLLKLENDSIIELINQKTFGVDDYEGYAAHIRYLVEEDDIKK